MGRMGTCSIDGQSGTTDVVKVNSHLEDAGPSAMQQDQNVVHHMLANSLAVVVARRQRNVCCLT